MIEFVIESKLIRTILILSIPAVIVLGSAIMLVSWGFSEFLQFNFGIVFGILLCAIAIEYDRQILNGAQSVFTGIKEISQNEKVFRGVFAFLTYGLLVFTIFLVLTGLITPDLFTTTSSVLEGLLGTIFAFYYPSKSKDENNT